MSALDLRRAKAHGADYILMAVGVSLVLIPLLAVCAAPQHFDKLQVFLRLIASLGGGLAGAAIPGLLEVRLHGVRAAGALALVALFWLFDPPSAVNDAIIEGPQERNAPAYDESKEVVFQNGFWKRQLHVQILTLSSPHAASEQ
jgi:hypothetical protein